MSTILQSVKKKIYAVCKDKMELSFGCEVQGYIPEYIESYEGPRSPALTTVGMVTNSEYLQIDEAFGDILIENLKKDLNYYVEEDGFEFEILGHPLGLPEVLRAIGKKIDFQIFQFDIQNNEMYLWDTGKDEETGFRWNLLVNLDGQSEEVWKFLDEIL